MLVSVGNGTRERSHLESVSSAADDVVARFEARKNLYVFSVAGTQFYFLFAISILVDLDENRVIALFFDQRRDRNGQRVRFG